MFKIDTTGAVASMPTPAALGSPSGWFAHGVDGVTPYTVLSSDWCNAVQAELLAVLTAAGISPDKTNQAQLLAALQKIGRIKLTGNLNLYVATTGNDSNTGLSAGAAFHTLQAAANAAARNYDTQGFNITVNVADGTYTSGATCTRLLGGGTLLFVGNVTTPANCIINLASPGSCFMANQGATINITGFKLIAGAGDGSFGLFTAGGFCLQTQAGQIVGDKLNFGTAASAHMVASNSGVISMSSGALTGSYTISGGSVYHMDIDSSGVISVAGTTVTCSGTLAFTGAFIINASGLGSFPSTTFSGGTVTGQRYLLSDYGAIRTLGGGANYFPGNSAGVTTNGAYT